MKTKSRLTKTFSFFLTLALCVPMFLALAAPASAATTTSRISFGLGTSACKGNRSDCTFPAHNSKVSVGQQLYINVAATSDIKLKSIEAYTSVNSEEYTLVGRETATNYMRWAYFPYEPTTAGTVTLLVRVYYTNGKSAQGTTTVNVTGTSASPVFSPVWPAQSANYISTLYYYWNGGNPSAHGTRSNRYNAIDIAGSGNVLAAESGTVVSAGWDGSGFGYAITIRHANGMYSLYGHLSSISVYADQLVTKGEVIGVMGSTGNSSGTHLHFELYNPSNRAQVINPWVAYYQGKVAGIVGGNSHRANTSFPSDPASQAWVSYLDNYGKRRSDGDYQL